MEKEHKPIYANICEEIKATVSLQDEMEKHGLILIRTGRRLKCVCPFHDDSDPSLCINIEDEVEWFFCFGCPKNGTVIDFIQNYHNLNLTDTKKYFCDNYSLRNSVNFVSMDILLEEDRQEKKVRHLIIPYAMVHSSMPVNDFLLGSINKQEDLKSLKSLLKDVDMAVDMEDRDYLRSACSVWEKVIEVKKKKREKSENELKKSSDSTITNIEEGASGS